MSVEMDRLRKASTVREGAAVVRSAIRIIDDLPGHSYWTHDDDETWEKWEKLTQDMRKFASRLEVRARNIENGKS